MTTRFEDLLVWQRARHLTADIYRVTKAPSFQGDRALANQLQRTAVSVMSNIAEGFERNSPGDYHRFLMIAKGSCGEIRAQLYVALDVGYIAETEFARLSRES
jgi:four helix bundle protein